MPTVNVPGIGDIQANGFAEESTLQNLVSLLGAQQGSRGQTGATNTRGVNALNRQSHLAAGAIAGVATSAATASTSFDSSASSVQRFTSSAQNLISQTSRQFMSSVTGTGGVGDTLTGLGATVSSVGANLGILGASTLGAAAGFLIAQIGHVAKAFETAQASGSSFGFTLEAFRDTASAANLTVGQLANVAKASGEALSRFGGGTTNGAKQFAELNSVLRQSKFSDDLLRFGMSFEQQAIAMADYTGMLATYGENIDNLNTQDVTKQFALLTQQQKKLAQFNGITLDQQRQEEKQRRQDIDLRALTMGMDADQRKAAETLATQLEKIGGPVAGQFMKEFMAHGTAVSAQAVMFAQLNPEIARTAREGVRGIKSATLDAGGIPGLIESADKELIKRGQQQSAQIIKMGVGTGMQNPLLDVAKASFIQIEDFGNKLNNQVMAKINADFKELKDTTDDLTGTYVAVADASQKVKVSMQNLSFAALEEASPLITSFNGMLRTATTELDKFAQAAHSQ